MDGSQWAYQGLLVLERIACGRSLSITNMQEFVALSMSFPQIFGFLEQLNVQWSKSMTTPCLVRKSQLRITGTDRRSTTMKRWSV